MLVQVSEFSLYAIFFLLDPITLNGAGLLVLFFFATGAFGLVFGVFLSTAIESAMTALNLCSGFAFYAFYISGMYWSLLFMRIITLFSI